MTRPVVPTPTTTVVVDEQQPPPGRTSWGAIFAGAVIALSVMALLELLMWWLGFAAIDPLSEPNPFAGIGTGMAIGYMITAAIALFVGGLVAGRLANKVNGTDVFLHGVLTWAVVTLVSLWLAVTVASALIGGALGLVGQAAGALGQGAAAVAPEIQAQIEEVIDDQQAMLEEFQDEMEPLWTDPAARREFTTVVDRIVSDGDPTVSEADREALIEVVATNTELSQAEAEAMVDDWIETYEEAQASLAQAEEDLRQAGEAAADALASTAMWAFFGLIVGAIITWLGARVGAPSSRPETRRA